MAKSDLQTAQQKWAQRLSQARKAGIPDNAVFPLMQKDLNAVSQLGASPMADKEVSDAIFGSMGISPIKDPSKGHDPIDILGNIPSDIYSLTTGFPGGVYNYIQSLPEQAASLGRLVGQKVSDPTGYSPEAAKLGMEQPGGLDIGDLLRNMNKVPVLSPLLPGVPTLAASTTPEGRKTLEEHPVSTLIDVMAMLAASGHVGMFGKPAVEKLEAVEGTKPGKVVSQAVDKGGYGVGTEGTLDVAELEKAAEGGNALDALRAGEPYKAAGRALMSGIEQAPIFGERLSRDNIRQVLMDMGAHPDLVDRLARPFGEIRNKNLLRFQKFLNSDVIRPITKLSEEDRALLAKNVTGTANEAEQAAFADRVDLQNIAQRTKTYLDEAARMNSDLQMVEAPWGREYVYAKNSPVAKNFTLAQKLGEDAQTAEAVMHQHVEAAAARSAKLGPDNRLTKAAYARAQDSIARYEKAGKAADEAGKNYREALRVNAPASFYSNLSDTVRSKLADYATTHMEHNSVELQAVLTRIQNSVTWADMADALGDPELVAQVASEVEQTWTALAQKGFDPVYLPNTPAERIQNIHAPSIILDARYAKAHISKETAFNLSRSVHDVAVGLVEYKRQLLTEAGTREFVDKVIKPWSKTSTEIHKSIESAIQNGHLNGSAVGLETSQIILDETIRHWVTWQPDNFGMSRYFPSPAGDETLIPKGVERSLRYLSKEDSATPLTAVWDKGMKVWRFSVLTTPRHISHVLLGGMMMGVLQDPSFILHFSRAIKLMGGIKAVLKGDISAANEELVSKLGRNINDFTTDQVINYSAGKSWGRMLTEINKGVGWVNKMEENATLMYKISMMLTKEGKALHEGLSPAAARAEGLRLANKFFVDMNAMTPFERVTMRKIFPFYGFTRHLFRYLMTYPSDHPIRASILTHFANQHYADWNTGLPLAMQFMFFLGPPDANGNVDAVDYRSIDPFRSFYNDFTLAGITSQMNPAAQFVAQQAGVNVLSATPELYPDKHYDPTSGTMVADRPPNLLLNALEAAVPQTQGLDALLGLSDQYRNLKVTDPQAFKHRVYTTLGIPFGPETINIPQKVEIAQMKRYKDAQTSIDKAVQTGDFSRAKRYAAVPIPSLLQRYFPHMTYATPGQVEAIYRVLQSQLAAQGRAGVSVHAVLPKQSSRRR